MEKTYSIEAKISLKMSLRSTIFFYIKNSVLDLNLFCSRSVLVLNIKTFSCSCSVLVREQEHVREHVPEQDACSFIPARSSKIFKTLKGLRQKLPMGTKFSEISKKILQSLIFLTQTRWP